MQYRSVTRTLAAPEASILAEEPLFRIHYINKTELRRRSTTFSSFRWSWLLSTAERAHEYQLLLKTQTAYYKNLGCTLVSLEILHHSVSDL